MCVLCQIVLWTLLCASDLIVHDHVCRVASTTMHDLVLRYEKLSVNGTTGFIIHVWSKTYYLCDVNEHEL